MALRMLGVYEVVEPGGDFALPLLVGVLLEGRAHEPAIKDSARLRPPLDDLCWKFRGRPHLDTDLFVPAVLALANPPWQQDVWLDPSVFENLDHVFHTLFDGFCDADEPEQYLGISLRTEEEVVLMRELGVALNAAAAEAPNDTDGEYLRAPSWSEVVAVAGRLAQVMVANDLKELAALHDLSTDTQREPHR
ncbi:SCO4402 family protein [Streptomyces sp. NPDC004069]